MWETEVRKHLLSRCPVTLSAFKIPKYLADMQYRSYCHNKVNLPLSGQNDLSTIVTQFASFADVNATFVTHLVLEWHLNAIEQNHKFFSVLQQFTNLKSLQLCPFVRSLGQPPLHSDTFPNPIPPEFSLSKLKKLIITVKPDDSRNPRVQFHKSNVFRFVRNLIPKIVPHFPNITHLGVGNVPLTRGQLRKDYVTWWSSFASKLTSFTLQTHDDLVRAVPPILFVAGVTINITRLDISCISYISAPDQFSNIVNNLAPRLTHLRYSGVRSYAKDEVCTVGLPILPKLKVFHLTKAPHGTDDWHGKVPEVMFKFGNEVLNYAVQFPSLEALIFEKEWGRNNGPNCEMPNSAFFETMVPLLYKSFMAEGTSPCVTLRRLDIPFPVGLKFRVGRDADDGWEWRDSAEFFERIRTTFPNLGYHVLEKAWVEGRVKRMEEFVKMGRELGCLEDDIHMMMRHANLLIGCKNV